MSTNTFQEDLRELYDIVANSEQENDVESIEDGASESAPGIAEERKPSLFSALSASRRVENDDDEDEEEEDEDSSESIVSSQLVRVKISKEVKKAYTKFFYPTVPAPLAPMLDDMLQLSARISGYFALLRYCLYSARYLASVEPAERAAIINDEAARIYRNVTAGDLSVGSQVFFESAASGVGHIVVPSKRYTNGIDIQFVGAPGAYSPGNNVPSLRIAYDEYSVRDIVTSHGGKSEDYTYQKEYLEAYATEFSQSVVAAGTEALQYMFGESVSSYGSAAKRVIGTRPLDFDFSHLNDIFLKHTRVVLHTDMLDNISEPVVSHFGEFFSIAVVRTPKATLVQELMRRLNTAQEGQSPINDNALESMLTAEGMAVSQILSVAPVLSLPEWLTNYITQTEGGERPSRQALHNWATIWAKRYIRAKGARTKGGRVRAANIPRFIMALSKSNRARDIRKQNGFHMEEGKGDENNVFIDPRGALQFGLPSSAREQIQKNLEGYERDLEEYIEFCFEHGIPATNNATLPPEVVVAVGDKSVIARYSELQKRVASYSGKLLSYDWDYNHVITANVLNPSTVVTADLVGAAKVDPLTMADYLGLNFAAPGEPPIQKTFADSMVLMVNHSLKDGEVSQDYVGNASTPTRYLEQGGVASALLPFYGYCVAKGRVPDAQALVNAAAKELGITELDTINQLIVGNTLSKDLTVPSQYVNQPHLTAEFILNMLQHTANHCSGSSTFRQMVLDENPGISMSELREQMEDHPHYFNPARSPASDFGRQYNYIGGMIFKLAMENLTKLDADQLFGVEGEIVINSALKLRKPHYHVVAGEIMPMAVMFSKYIPNAEQIIAEAEREIDANTPDPSISEDDVRASGGIAGAQLFPHQVKTHQSLRKRPKFAILDIAPGGGKTSIGQTDIASMVTELNEIGERNIKPLIICPDGLIKNWVDDMKIFTGATWNLIPVNSHVLDRWGYERLEELLRSAPVNTVVVTGFNFLTSKQEAIVFGSSQVKVSNNLEFMKRFGFDYICIDESHKLKKHTTVRHRTVKQLTTASHVRYLRIASGTIISNRVDDIVGQVALYNAHIFRSGEVSDMSVSESVSINGEAVPLWAVDTPGRARQKLSRYASVITMKKKEWAFMLPSPIETFIAVPMVPDVRDGVTEEEILQGEMHKQLYDAVLQESVEDLEDLLKKAQAKQKASGEDWDEDDNDDEEATDGGNLDVKAGKDQLAILKQSELRPYLARMERLVTNPMADPLAPDIFGLAGIKSYHSTKARFIAKRIDTHFNPEKWEKGKRYKEYTLVEHNGKLYLARKLDKTTHIHVALPDSTIGISPDVNTEVWKEEAEGKILVFCRFTNSVNGIYAALPEHYKKIAVKYTGEETDKASNLDAFMNDPRIKILVANEMGIAEGYNMQMASRIIRVESPWAPGDLDQSSSRIFRPDPKAAKAMVTSGKPGELYREAVFLDWILCDNTMEIAKQARLIAKIFNKARFDEAENDRYTDVLDAYSLDEIPMSLDTLRSRQSLDDFQQYVEAYAVLNGLQREEFHEMRVTMDATMKDLQPQPEVSGSKKVQTPFVSNQKPEDPLGLKPVSLKNLLRQDEYVEYAQDPSRLEGMPVITDRGFGRIAAVRVRYLKRAELDADGNPVRGPGGKIKKIPLVDTHGRKMPDPDNPISSYTVKLADSNEVLRPIKDTGVVFIPTKLDAKTAAAKFRVNNLNVTKTDIRKAEREEEREEKARRKLEEAERRRQELEEEKSLVEEAKRRRKLKKEAEARAAAAEDGRKRKKNIEQGKPINQGIQRVSKVPAINKGIQPEDATQEKPTITLHPAYYHGFLTLEARADDPDAIGLGKYKFKPTGPYAYVTADRYNRFDKVLDFLEANFELSSASVKRLDVIQDAFEEGPKGIYRMELAKSVELPYLFATRRKKVTNRREVRPYPIILPNELQIAVDLVTCPAIRKYIGQAIPGAVTKWQQHEGHHLYFANTKAELRNKIKELKAAGYVIDNENELNAEIANIKFRVKSNK